MPAERESDRQLSRAATEENIQAVCRGPRAGAGAARGAGEREVPISLHIFFAPPKS